MDERVAQVTELRAYISRVQRDITLLLQSLQWDEDTVLRQQTVSYSSEHRSESCELNLPIANDSLDSVVTLTSADIMRIIESAANSDPLFKKGKWRSEVGAPNSEPDLRTMFTVDERRAIYNAVAERARFQPSSSNLNLINTLPENKGEKKYDSRVESQSESRDAKRRPTKYRVSNAAANYSHVLREVIHAQMTTFKSTVMHKEQTGNMRQEQEQLLLNKLSTEKTQNKDEKYYNKGDRKTKEKYANDRTKHLHYHRTKQQQYKSRSPSQRKEQHHCQYRDDHRHK